MGETPQQTYERLKMLMMTSIGKNGTGTTLPKFKSGKDAYSATLPKGSIMTTQVAGDAAGFATALAAIAAMKDVEAMIYWGTDANGRSQGGHAAFISEIICIKNPTTGQTTGYKVVIIDDRPQGDGMAGNTSTTLEFGPTGALAGYGTGASMIGFQIEMWVPEPSGVALMFVALAGVLQGARRRRRRLV
jgi:hypothetical protein